MSQPKLKCLKLDGSNAKPRNEFSDTSLSNQIAMAFGVGAELNSCRVGQYICNFIGGLLQAFAWRNAETRLFRALHNE